MGIYPTMRMIGLVWDRFSEDSYRSRTGSMPAFVAGALFVFLGILLVQVRVTEVPAAQPTDTRKFKIIDRELISAGIIGATIVTLITASDFSMMTTLETQFNARLDMTALGFSIAFSALMLSRLIFQIPLGRLSDRIGRKPLVIGGIMSLIGGWVVYQFVPETITLQPAAQSAGPEIPERSWNSK